MWQCVICFGQLTQCLFVITRAGPTQRASTDDLDCGSIVLLTCRVTFALVFVHGVKRVKKSCHDDSAQVKHVNVHFCRATKVFRVAWLELCTDEETHGSLLSELTLQRAPM